jgi:hypothetical protein
MRALSGTAIALSLLATTCLAAKLPTTNLRGDYVEARTSDVYTGPCFANGEVGQTGKLALMGWHVQKGEWQGVDLSGLSVMGVVRSQNTLGDYASTSFPSKAVIIVDEKATPEQRMALQAFAQQMSGELLSDVVKTVAQPIDFKLADNSVHSMKAEMVAGNLAKIATRPLNEGDQICHNEGVFYPPLTATDHAMAAYTLANSYEGKELGESWSYPEKRSAFVASFHYAN